MVSNVNYFIAIFIFAIALYIVFASNNLTKKLYALSLFQTSILWLYISLGKVTNASPPILHCLAIEICPENYSNPLPQVLMLTAIVVGLTTFALGLKFISLIQEKEK